MLGEHEQQPQTAWETVMNGVEKLVLWLDLGLLYSCPSFCHTLIFSESISKTQPIYFFTLLNVEVSRYQSLSIFSDVITDKMSLVVVRMSLSFYSFLSLCTKGLVPLLFDITTSDFPSCWQNVMYPL